MDEQLTNYLKHSLPPQKDWVMELEKQAKKDHVPIMDAVSMNFIIQLVKLKKPKKILEIGTAIGYSALRMLEAYPDANLITIEKDEQRYHEAIENINKQNKEGNITVIFGDALEKISDLVSDNETFDLIFIDAAKGQYKRFFELVSPLLNNNGLILSDNVLFRGHVAAPDNAHPRHKKMVEKIQKYNEWLIKHSDFTTSIVPIGDGVAISLKQS
ncbi:SAM-dependent methyltransferase [Virgibacillus profundi]|uniref:tRNA 5-hydroxyuridine methyltransferase n=1 Tax=Virgibacillus profundi TaxID=2024555 RepID=A0A2A2ICV7_9BACI|nr:O-methyltransferase [Virgibacillus profundi]PAV28960.1 SAM-dependent methyltransferase [Virgibacillus profundi]PXY53128.1 O-methyltransferase [Virgibacillus profundi]